VLDDKRRVKVSKYLGANGVWLVDAVPPEYLNRRPPRPTSR